MTRSIQYIGLFLFTFGTSYHGANLELFDGMWPNVFFGVLCGALAWILYCQVFPFSRSTD